MGTYTTNKELFMPTVGETGWGTLVNGNFETIDNFLKPITVSGSTYTFTGNQTGGSISATSISNSGTLTQTGTSTFTGKITANGGIGTKALTATTGTFSGAVTALNVNKYGFIPIDLILSDTSSVYRVNYYMLRNSVLTGAVASSSLSAIVYIKQFGVGANSTYTYYVLPTFTPGDAGYLYAISNVFIEKGSWSFDIYCSLNDGISVKLTLSDGTILNLTQTETPISLARFRMLCTSLTKVEVTNSNTNTTYVNLNLYINNDSNVGMYMFTLPPNIYNG